jgi:hypothetical protein
MTSRVRGRGFRFFTGDVSWLDYGGTWIRQVAARRYHFLELTNMDEACGRDNEGSPRYVVELSEVDLDAIGPDVQRSAWESCDGDSQIERADSVEVDTTERDLVAAGACYQYGAKAPLHSETTSNAHKGIRACRAESYRLTSDAEAYAAAMERPVNKIGSTAAEYMRGDVNAAILRGCDEGNPSARLMAKMYVAAEGKTLGGQIPPGDLEAMKEKL